MKLRSAIVAIVALAMLRSGALAEGNAMGVFFSDSEFTDATTDIDAGPDPIELYIVVLDCAFGSVDQYECSLEFTGPNLPTVLGASGPAGSGWTNFGDDLNHLVRFLQPPVAVGGAAVLGIVTVEYVAPSLVEILMNASTPTSIPGFPVIANGIDPDDITACTLTGGWEIPGVVATINGGGITPIDADSWTAVRNLFD